MSRLDNRTILQLHPLAQTLRKKCRESKASTWSFLAQGAGVKAFLLGKWFRRGYCYIDTMQVEQAQFDEWASNRVSPECAEGDGWVASMIYDFYALVPPPEED